ncbi:MAG: DUF971 domain-containing protein [Myxococcales bacterium]|nr:DUF971 domain-containing protein [Myxococcales bacterium]
MKDDDQFELVEVHAPRGAEHMTAVFADEHRVELPHRVLRGFCPCAGCQGHDAGCRFVEGGDLTLSEVIEVGNYALRLTWGDGHSTGIYSFRYLRALCACVHCCSGDPTARTFERRP